MQLGLALTSETSFAAVSPLLEMGSYEALWVRPGTTFKTLAKQFHDSPDTLPSTFVSREVALEHASEALKLARDAGTGDFGVRIHGAGEYPASLRDAKHPVELLYYQGVWALTETRRVSVVGTRNPTAEGRKRAAQLVRGLVAADFTIVSGLAAGIDTVSHTTALACRGRTIAVIGTPVSFVYPSENVALQAEIARTGLLISQVPFLRYSRQQPSQNRLFFPERNATMAALSEATVIVEAGETSGTLIQARAALYQKRKLFILNSNFDRPGLTWPHRLVEQGAVRVRDLDEILRALSHVSDAPTHAN